MADNENLIRFQMTEKEYLAALKFRNKLLSKSKINAGALILCALFFAALLPWIFKNVQAGALAAALFVLVCAFMLIKRKSEGYAFSSSPVLNTPHLIKFGSEIEITNSFEKIICPNFNVFAAAQTGEYLFIIATLRKGCFCINKSRYASPALEKFISHLSEAGKIKGDI